MQRRPLAGPTDHAGKALEAAGQWMSLADRVRIDRTFRGAVLSGRLRRWRFRRQVLGYHLVMHDGQLEKLTPHEGLRLASRWAPSLSWGNDQLEPFGTSE